MLKAADSSPMASSNVTVLMPLPDARGSCRWDKRAWRNLSEDEQPAGIKNCVRILIDSASRRVSYLPHKGSWYRRCWLKWWRRGTLQIASFSSSVSCRWRRHAPDNPSMQALRARPSPRHWFEQHGLSVEVKVKTPTETASTAHIPLSQRQSCSRTWIETGWKKRKPISLATN